MRIALLTVPTSSGNRSTSRWQSGFLPPLGLASLASVLEKAEHEVKLLDCAAEDLTLADISSRLQAFSPDIVGLSFTTQQHKHAYRLAHLIRDSLPSAILLGGGPHITCRRQNVLERKVPFDAIVTGEGEYALQQLAIALENSLPGYPIQGVTWFINKGIVQGADILPSFNLDPLPFPARHLLDIKKYIPEPHESKLANSTTMVVSRGCSYAQCSFCLRSGPFYRPYRVQSVKKTIAELEMLQQKHSIREVQFFDDNLFSNREWIEKFSSELLRKGLEISWFARGSPGMISHETLALAGQAGLFGLEIGYESGNQETLDLVQKGVTLEQSLNVARWTKKLGIEVAGNFIIGFPGETPEMGMRTLAFAKRVNPTFALFVPLHPEPGTRLYEQARRGGTILMNPYEGKSHKSRFFPSVSYIPKDYESEEQLARIVKKAYLEFYLRPSKLLSYLMTLTSLTQLRRFLLGFSYFKGLIQ